MTEPSIESPTARYSPPTDLRGRYLWYDLMTPDVPASVAFYTAVVGWTTTPYEAAPDNAPYLMWTNAAGQPIGGSGNLPAKQTAAGVPAHWVAYVGTPDVDATIAEAERLGATALGQAMDIPSVGRVAILLDPQGAAFAIYTPASAPAPTPDAPGVGDASWHELYTTDLEAAFSFYHHLFGWGEAGSMEMGGGMGRYLMFGRGEGHMYGGMMQRPTADVPPNWTPYFRVPDVDAAVAQVRERGGQVVVGPMEVPGGDRVAQCVDPEGAWFGVHQRVG